MNAIQTLEQVAIHDHQAGRTWSQFWQQHGHEVRAAEPHSQPQFQQLLRMLLSLVVAGNEDGAEPAGEPWLFDNVPTISAPPRRNRKSERLLNLCDTHIDIQLQMGIMAETRKDYR